MKYVCELCGFVYDETVRNIKAGILPEGDECPGCDYHKEALNPVQRQATLLPARI